MVLLGAVTYKNPAHSLKTRHLNFFLSESSVGCTKKKKKITDDFLI